MSASDLKYLAAAVARASAAGSPRPEAEESEHYVINRHGEREPVRFDRITQRNTKLQQGGAYGPRLGGVDVHQVTVDVAQHFRSGMTTRELDAQTVSVCVQRAAQHRDYETLAARICVSDLHKRTPARLEAVAGAIREAAPDNESFRMSGELWRIIERAAPQIAARLAPDRDYRLKMFGYQTLARSYLLRPSSRKGEPALLDPQLTERPQHLYMRIALGVFVCQPDGRGGEAPDAVFGERLEEAFAFYDALSLQLVSNATPTLLNAGTDTQQLSSCFQLATGDDLDALFHTVLSASRVSKRSGGVSLWLHNVRAEGSPIRRTGGQSSGLKHYIKVLNSVQQYVDQGGNRPGAFAVYLSVDHADVLTFLRLGLETGDEALGRLGSPDLKYALWVSDEFMRALEAQLGAAERTARGEPADPTAGDWPLFSPHSAPGLHLVFGEEYRQLRARYTAEGRAVRTVKAGDIVAAAFKLWAQKGTPYIGYKDAANAKSNMNNVAPICSSNLCTEILIPSWSDFDAGDFARFHPGNGKGEYGVCNLAAICLASFFEGREFDFAGVADASGLEVRALNRVIDVSCYPTEECERGNRRHRPIGVGIMGFADALARLKLAYDTQAARAFARAAAASVYYGALRESARLAEADGPYSTFEGSPVSRGELQPDLWAARGEIESTWEADVETATRGFLTPARWAELRAAARRGVRNAYVTAYMPTATTSNIAGQNESFEPYTSNAYTRRTLAGEFLIVNPHLEAELCARGLWDAELRAELLAAGGSVQGIRRLPEETRRRYRTAREIHPTNLVRMAAAMAPFVCQALSLNLYLDAPELPKILSFMFAAWRAGLKTGPYYTHTRAAAGAQRSAPALAASPPARAGPPPAADPPARAGPLSAAEVRAYSERAEDELRATLSAIDAIAGDLGSAEGGECTACAL